ncbi:MAG: hypothetical protein ABEL76_16355, partial [Bradymonadaceae bacterium]
MFSFLRYDRQRGAAWLVVANFDESSHSPRVRIPREAQQFAGFDRSPRVTFTPALADAAPLETSSETLVERGVEVDVSARSVRVFDVSTP